MARKFHSKAREIEMASAFFKRIGSGYRTITKFYFSRPLFPTALKCYIGYRGVLTRASFQFEINRSSSAPASIQMSGKKRAASPSFNFWSISDISDFSDSDEDVQINRSAVLTASKEKLAKVPKPENGQSSKGSSKSKSALVAPADEATAPLAKPAPIKLNTPSSDLFNSLLSQIESLQTVSRVGFSVFF